MKKIGKRGELTSGQIIALVILIISFVIIMIFFFILNPKDEITKESCRNSVMLRSSEFGKSVKLQCRTQNICISGGGECLDVSKDTQKIDVRSKDELYDALANLMYECWWQMGEGKVDYAPKGYGFTEKYCNICDMVLFDDKLKGDSDLNSINMGEFYNYMANKKVANGDSLLYYLYKLNSMSSVRDYIYSNTNGQIDILNEKLDLTQDTKYALVTSVTKQGYGMSIVTGAVATGIGIAVGVMTFNPGSAVWAAAGVQNLVKFVSLGTQAATKIGIPTSVLGAGGAGWTTGLFITNGNQQYQPPTLYPFNSAAIKGLECKEYTSQAA